MKILLANQSFGFGGITTYAVELIKCLSQDHELTVVLPDDSVNPITVPGVKVLHHDTMGLSKQNALFFIKLINEELKPDLVISSQGLIIPVIVPFLDDKIRVMTVSHSGKYFTSEYSAFNQKYTDDIIAASSDYNKKYLEKKFHVKDKSKIKVIYNFLDSNPELENFHLTKKDSTPISIIYPGGTLPLKNPKLVLSVLCKLVKTDLDFKFYWTGGTSFLPKNKRLGFLKINDIRQFFIDDKRVVFTGFIKSKAELDHLMASCNVLLVPSRNEGCSMVLLEAIRSGSICMVGDYLHGNREIVERGECGFVLSHRSADDFAKQLIDIISKPSDYQTIYDKSYQAYKELFTYPVWKCALEKVLTGEASHTKRKQKVSGFRLTYDAFRLKMLRNSDHYKRRLFAIESIITIYMQYFKLKIKGDFPLNNNRK